MANSHSSGWIAGSSGAGSKELYIYEIPPSQRQLLVDHLDALGVWPQLAKEMTLNPADVQNIRRKQAQNHSPTEELLKIWGGQYNHMVKELFRVLYNLKLHEGMRILKDFVEQKYHTLIPNTQPMVSDLLRLRNGTGPDQKQSHKSFSSNTISSSGVSDSNNISTTSEESEEQGQRGPTYLSPNKVKEYASCLNEIPYDALTAATNNWSENNVLGKGGFGTVYKGDYKHTDVAIKQLHYRSRDGRDNIKVQIQQSLNELKFLNTCRHDNVVALYGFSLNGEKPCLVYQLMPGGTLDQRLYSRKLPPLTWQQRMNICVGTARGINYLHTFRNTPLIHGDIKPANVLLDQCLHPKIGDFGLAREGPKAVNSAIEVSQLFGTEPYLPPEFIHLKHLSTQVDTFSFGVVLLETFTGLRAYDKTRALHQRLLSKYILLLCVNGVDVKLEDLIDKKVPFLPGEQEMCSKVIQLGIDCIANDPQQRPDMEKVLETIKLIQFSN